MDIRKQLDKAMSKPAADEKWFAEKYPELAEVEMDKKSKKQKILDHLRFKGPITPLMALDLFGCFSLAQRIKELKEDGWKISKRMVKHRKDVTFAEYTLEA